MQGYSDPDREDDRYSLPDIEVFQLTAEEVVAMDDDLMYDASKQFPLSGMNSRERDNAIDWAIAESGATGGWFWHACFPGCLPDGPPSGPFDSYRDALADAQSNNE